MSAPKGKKTKNNKPGLLIPIVASLSTLTLVSVSYLYALNKPKIEEQKPSTPTPTTAASSVELIEPIALPAPDTNSRLSLDKALELRRSRRDFTDHALSIKQVSQILWAGQGVTSSWGGRTVPSAKSIYPLTLYLIASKVDSLNPGLYRYIPGDSERIHQLILVKPGEFRSVLSSVISQSSVKEAPATFLLTGNFDVMAAGFEGKRSDDHVYLEAGHAGQNIYLEVESLGLGTVSITHPDMAKIAKILFLPEQETPIYLFPVGFPKS